MPETLHDGVALAYDDRGTGDPAYVFVHGWTCDRSMFAPQARHFAQQHRAVSIDLRGHGESDKPRGEYPIATHANDVAHLIETLGVTSAVIVGHSLGAQVALQLAATRPDRVAAIVLVDPAPLVFPPELRAALEGIADASEAGNQEPRRQFIVNNLFLPTSDRRIVDEVLAVALATPGHVAASAMRGLLAFDSVSAATQCRVPVLHLAGLPLNPPHLMSQWIPAVVNGWTVGAGHFNQLEVPDQVNSMIEGFVRHYVSSPAAATAAHV